MVASERYSRHILLRDITKKGQEKLTKGRVAVLGCGALGTTIANNLVRSGVGFVRIIDRDVVELSNLQRQILFDENDVGYPKALAAADKLKRINSEVTIESVVDDITHKNIENVIKTMDVIVDGTDNMLIRFLMNDVSIKHTIPWIYGGAIETYGMTMSIVPQKTPCFRCVIPDIPTPGSLATCDTVGVINSIPAIIASMQSTEALKILLETKPNTDLLVYDVWTHDFQRIKIKRKKDCECCGKNNYEFLHAKKKEEIVSLCGRGGFQITPIKNMGISFEELGKKLKKLGDVEMRSLVLRFKIPGYELNIFRNGRAIVIGTNNINTAKILYAKYIGF